MMFYISVSQLLSKIKLSIFFWPLASEANNLFCS